MLTNIGGPDEMRTPNNSRYHVEDASSRHPGGINAVFCDGSVRFVRDSINPTTWSYLGTRASGEVLGDF